MKERIAVYAGTFDPPTVGHVWMIEQGAALFDRLIVAIAINPEKRCMFSGSDRIDMLRRTTEGMQNVGVDTVTNRFLIAYARSIGARFVLRGIRSGGDYEYERTMRNVNGDIDPDIATVFLMPPRAIAEVSSSMVKGLVGPEGWETVVERYLPRPALEKLKEHEHAKRK